MKKFVFLAGILAIYATNACAYGYNDDEFIPQSLTSEIYGDESSDVVVTEEYTATQYYDVPMRSYYAYPNDINFVPETEFMNMDNEINYDDVIYQVRSAEYMYNPGVQFAERPTVICRNFNCTRLNDRITRTFLFNSLSNMFMTNTHSRVYICEADPFSRSCLQSGISFPVRAGVANALVKIPKATVSQVNLTPGLSRATATMTYEFLINGIKHTCEPTIMDIAVPNNSQATLMNREFACNLTSDGMSNVSLLLNVDYIDLDYGLIGAYYSLGLQGPTIGASNGYLLFKTEFTTSSGTYRTTMYRDSENLDYLGRTIQPGEYTVGAYR